MKIAIASDHGGFQLKTLLLQFLKKRKKEDVDLRSHGKESGDYPDYAVKVAELVSQGLADAGLLLCGTGIGMSIVANKFPNVRAAVVSEDFSARMAKEHNNTNVLCLGGRLLDADKDAER